MSENAGGDRMRLTISHGTVYTYDAPIDYALQELRLTPKSRAGQTVLSWETTIEGGRKELEFDDHHNNHVMLVSGEPGRRELSIHCTGEVEIEDRAGIVGSHGGYAPLWLFRRATPLTKPGPQVRKLASGLGNGFDGDIERLHALSQAITDRVSYELGTTHTETAAEEALQAGSGVCQDHAQIFVSAARLLGFPARYVSGYLMMNDRVEQDATHAWAEAHIEAIGWVGFDVSNGISPDGRYVRVATGLDYKDAAPVSGMTFGQASGSLDVVVQVEQ